MDEKKKTFRMLTFKNSFNQLSSGRSRNAFKQSNVLSYNLKVEKYSTLLIPDM